ncbi:MAG: M23 family metallopeptidase [Actinomycetales bacterium]|nr:M23 family metallopeptidase [Actinomycetales bacterium]
MNDETFEELARLLGTPAPRPMTDAEAPAAAPVASASHAVESGGPLTRRELRRRELEAAEAAARASIPVAPPIASALPAVPAVAAAPAPIGPPATSTPAAPAAAPAPDAPVLPADLAAIFPADPITSVPASELLAETRRSRSAAARGSARSRGRGSGRGRGSSRGRGGRGPTTRTGAVRTVSRGASARSEGRKLGARLLSAVAMLFVGALAVAMSLPANALVTAAGTGASADATVASGPSAAGAQDLVVAPTTTVETPTRDGWNALSYAQVLAEKYGSRDYTYAVSSGPIRWPFPYTATISDGYGPRVSPCAGCSSFHQGVDFTPGSGAAIYAIADGVVLSHVEDDWSYGNNVVIRHQIDGQTVDSLYAHMQPGTCPLQPGDPVSVGDFVGLVGETGEATGPHLHLEIHVEGVKVDPFAWLQAHVS